MSAVSPTRTFPGPFGSYSHRSNQTPPSPSKIEVRIRSTRENHDNRGVFPLPIYPHKLVARLLRALELQVPSPGLTFGFPSQQSTRTWSNDSDLNGL